MRKKFLKHFRGHSGMLRAWPFMTNFLIIQLKPVVGACEIPPPLLFLLHGPHRSRKLFNCWWQLTILGQQLAFQVLRSEASDPEEVFDSNGTPTGDSECAEDPLSSTLFSRRRIDGAF
jgi:hypothetical protein